MIFLQIISQYYTFNYIQCQAEVVVYLTFIDICANITIYSINFIWVFMPLIHFALSLYIKYLNKNLMKRRFESVESMVEKINELLSNGVLKNIQYAQFCDGDDTIGFYRALNDEFSLKVICTKKSTRYQITRGSRKNVVYSISKENRRDFIEPLHSLSFSDIELSISRLIESSIQGYKSKSICN